MYHPGSHKVTKTVTGAQSTKTKMATQRYLDIRTGLECTVGCTAGVGVQGVDLA